MASLGIFMRKPWHYLVLGWAGGAGVKGAAAVSTAPRIGWYVPKSIPEARVTIENTPILTAVFFKEDYILAPKK